MSVSIVRLELGSFESLPQHTRRCVFWEVEPTANGESYESEFDKEAWISGLLLEWGACGQVAIESTTNNVIGTAFYAPPNRVPRSQHFPTSPVSHDAVLLTSIRTEPGHDEVATILLDAVLGDLIRRGVRAVESFGLVRNGAGAAEFCSPTGSATSGSTESGPASTGGALPDLDFWTDEAIIEVAREILEDPQADLCTACMIDASFLKNSGFDVVSSHQRFPRFRLELDEGLGWKFEVESALEKLVVMAEIDLAGRQRTAVPVGSGTARVSAKRSPRPGVPQKCKCP
ncbi:hypothetical protein [Gordonia amicalis]|uniref:hypothetical protein n=1 Tax=Gordonia amicalis TaxID=89053 RepID=UPI0002A64906|nr:hypothetical protein [Gordonia amicalis]MBA5846585.1 hypothetical protein [Gordonia amicalis]NKX79414.1 hypothetical protein [Gordonia amicalis]UOG20248.1 hypothetical protein MTX80_13615 [Gordonia amicalis]GAC54457.1 hypothetical protein GOAMI_31_00700 [Gordonia amicalis NBRC 100051 = JCM 11271]